MVTPEIEIQSMNQSLFVLCFNFIINVKIDYYILNRFWKIGKKKNLGIHGTRPALPCKHNLYLVALKPM